ncbi:MAG: glycosyltransferase family 2 protein [Chloroflexi bacterium]|nr:glycosyltransferase family 2 protein [Chloroflexota bacterium]
MPTISAIVIAKNERRHIAACLESLSWADELIVVDSFSSDQTPVISRRFTEKVFQRPFDTFPKHRNASLELASGDWVFFLDADERVTPELAEETRSATAVADKDAYWVPRRNIILGKWIQHTGWYPDYQLRLFRRDKGRYDEKRQVHETLILEGEAGRLRNTIVHYNYRSLGELLGKQSRYADYEAKVMLAAGLEPKSRNLVLQPAREFLRRYVTWRGYLDGFHGLLLSLVMAWYNLVVYVRLARIRSKDRATD